MVVLRREPPLIIVWCLSAGRLRAGTDGTVGSLRDGTDGTVGIEKASTLEISLFL